MPDIFFDFGNADVKYFDGDTTYGYFRHAIAPITQSQWQAVVSRAKQPPIGYIAINGSYFALGDKARRYQIKEKPKGAARYVDDYYGVAMCYAISELFDNSTRIVNLYASHAPQDIRYADNIIDACARRWKFVTHNGDYNLNVKHVDTFDEPLGGFNHAVLTKEGYVLKSNKFRKSTLLVIDVGGFTVDVVAVDPNGMIDESSLGSTRTGAMNVFQNFEDELRNRYSDLFRNTHDIDEMRLEAAILRGYYQFGNQKLDCATIGTQAINSLVNDIRDVMRANGGIANYDVVLLTGGGSALVYDALNKAEQYIDFVMAEKKRDNMRYANVFGGAKMFTMLKRLGLI